MTDVAEDVAVGGWPGLRGRDLPTGLLAVRDYLDEIARVEVGRVDGTHRDPNRVARMLQSLARNVSTQRLLGDLKLLGFLFESLAVRDLRIYAQALDAQVSQYRDSSGFEVDAIVETRDGHWMAFEVKLGHGQIDAAAANLTRFAEQIDTTRCGTPALLGVIVATGCGYRRKDGVAVIPLGALGP